jgi:hypothetical protein
MSTESPASIPSTQLDPTTASTSSQTSTVPVADTAAPPTTAELVSNAPVTAPPVDASAGCDGAGDPPPPPQATAELTEVGRFDNGTVYAAEYPVPDDRGDPWSQWGQGVVLPDGRFVSGVGDHRGADGRSWFYEFDPTTRSLIRTAEVSDALDHRAGDWGYGKLHAPMVLDRCDKVVTSTYWGTRRDLVVGGSYDGDHLIRYDPAGRTITSLGVPVPGHGLPSLAISPDRSTIFAEAVDPASDPDTGTFVIADAESGSVHDVISLDDHRGFRDVLVTPEGDALVATANGLGGQSASGEPLDLPAVFGGESWFRSASDPAQTGDVVMSTRSPDQLWLRDAAGQISLYGDSEGYVASIDLVADGSTAYYVPGAHGQGARIGTPLIALDVDSGQRTEIVRLNDLIEPALGLRVGGSFNTVADEANGRVFVGLNAGDAEEEDVFGSVVLAVVEFDEPGG